MRASVSYNRIGAAVATNALRVAVRFRPAPGVGDINDPVHSSILVAKQLARGFSDAGHPAEILSHDVSKAITGSALATQSDMSRAFWKSLADACVVDDQLRRQLAAHGRRGVTTNSTAIDDSHQAVDKALAEPALSVDAVASRLFEKTLVDACIAEDQFLKQLASFERQDMAATSTAADSIRPTVSKAVAEPPISTGALESWAAQTFAKALLDACVADDQLSEQTYVSKDRDLAAGGAATESTRPMVFKPVVDAPVSMDTSLLQTIRKSLTDRFEATDRCIRQLNEFGRIQSVATDGAASDALSASLSIPVHDIAGSTDSDIASLITKAFYEGQSYASTDYFADDYVAGETEAPRAVDSAELRMQSYVDGNYFAEDYVVGTNQSL